MRWPWQHSNREVGVGPVTPLTPEQIASDEAKVLRRGYWARLAVAFDDLGNVAFLNGRDDETISAHAARLALDGNEFGKIMCDILNLAQSDHGANAIIGDMTRAELIEALEKGSGIPT